MEWFWIFMLYSFAGYLLEKVFAAVTRSAHQVRKCFLLLPLCPVYGFAMLTVLHLPAELTDSFWRLALYGGMAATGAEYVTHFLYEKLLGVMFWDYSPTRMDLNRRICLPFSVAWGLLAALSVRYVQPWVLLAAGRISPAVTYGAWLLLIVDGFFSVKVLLSRRDIDLLGWHNLLRELQGD